MKVGLITIGAELLNGTRTDTNAAWIGQSLTSIGAKVDWHITVNDEKDSILNALNNVPKNINIVFCTGGLGPTHDDITATVLYEYFGDKPKFDEEYWDILTEKFSKRGSIIPESNRNQAVRPSNGDIIPNPSGSARGLHFKNDRYDLFSMPGVPLEMKAMMEKSILPWIEARIENKIFVSTFRTTGIMESVLYERIEPLLENHLNVDVAFLPKFIGVDLRISSYDKTAFDEFLKDVFPIIDKYHFGSEDIELEEALGEILIAKNKSVATAESCTGGLIADRLTNVSGSSLYFKGGIVAYTNAIKIKALNVKEETLTLHGAVSEHTALEMANGARESFVADIGISTTGIAGPSGGTKNKQVGLVYVGISTIEYKKVFRFTFTPDRKTNKLMTSQAALNILRLYLLNGL